jgi:L-rhamnose-H+ transport protein
VVERFWLGMAIIFCGGILNGGFALPLKYSKRWKWENTWSVFSVIGILLLPWFMAVRFVPHLASVYQSVSPRVIIWGILFGLLWGISQVTFGLSLVAVGMAVAVSVVSGLVCASGALVPLLVMNPSAFFRPRGLFLLCSMPILLVGLGMYVVAGRLREKEQAPRATSGVLPAQSFKVGLALCVFTGTISSAFNLGFAFSGDIIRKSMDSGAQAATAGYGVWSLVLGAGFFPNILYCAYLFRRNRTFSAFLLDGWSREMLLAVGMAVIWLSGLFLYGWGATLVGIYGTSIGFTLFMAMSVLSSTGLGLLTGEWDSTSLRSRRWLAAGVTMILVSIVVLNSGGVFAG